MIGLRGRERGGLALRPGRGTVTFTARRGPNRAALSRTERRLMQAVCEKQMSDVVVLPIQGDALVSTTVARFKKQLEELAADTNRVVVDLSGIQFIDSAGCGALLQFHKQLLSKGGGLKVCCVTPPVRALFELVRMQRVLEIHPDREQALRSFAG